jgi:hypothetical protein
VGDDPLGETTQDLHALGQPHPAEQPPTTTEPAISTSELSVRRYGGACIIGGCTIMGLTVIAVLAIPDRLADLIPKMVVHTITNASMIAGSALLIAGLIERLGRYGRAMHRRLIAEQREFTERLLAKQEELSRQQFEVMAFMAPLPGQLNEILEVIDKVPAFSDGMIAGVQVASKALSPDRD